MAAILDLAIFRNGSFSKFVVLSIVDICAKLQTSFQKLTIVKSKFTNPLSYSPSSTTLTAFHATTSSNIKTSKNKEFLSKDTYTLAAITHIHTPLSSLNLQIHRHSHPLPHAPPTHTPPHTPHTQCTKKPI